MGIDYKAKVIYGLPLDVVQEEIRDELIEDVHECVIDYASPYYDCPSYEWIVGIEVYTKQLNDPVMLSKIKDIFESHLVEIGGKDYLEHVQLHITPHVY